MPAYSFTKGLGGKVSKTSPVKDDVREEVEVEVEEEVEKRPRLKVPEDYEDRANNDLWDWNGNQKKVWVSDIS